MIDDGIGSDRRARPPADLHGHHAGIDVNDTANGILAEGIALLPARSELDRADQAPRAEDSLCGGL